MLDRLLYTKVQRLHMINLVDLDVTIAKILGHRIVKKQTTTFKVTWQFTKKPFIMTEDGQFENIPPYSTDFSTAWNTLVPAANKDDWDVSLFQGRSTTTASFRKGNREHWARHENPATALCLAFLALHGIQLKENKND